MKKHLLFILIIVLLLAGISGCDVFTTMFGSSEAVILDYASDYIVGEPVIDLAARTIEVTVKLMDLSLFEPEITVSEFAELSGPESIEDGVAAEYTVTAENGEALTWTVTATMQYGITFVMNGTEITLLHGFSDSENPEYDAALGSGVPGIVRYTDSDYSQNYILGEEDDLAVDESEITWDYVSFYFEGLTTGSFDGEFYFTDSSEDKNYYSIMTVDVSSFADSGGDFKAVFCKSDESAGRALAADIIDTLTDGIAKLKVVTSGPEA